jgi:hypothetical protein
MEQPGVSSQRPSTRASLPVATGWLVNPRYSIVAFQMVKFMQKQADAVPVRAPSTSAA